jgi:hypothetical protein
MDVPTGSADCRVGTGNQGRLISAARSDWGELVDGEGRKLEQRMVVEYGVTLDDVWLPLAMLRRLRAHGPWDAPFTEANADQERVLLAHALAERHNERGLHRGIGLSGFLDAIPFEPTVPFEKVADARRSPSPRAQ